MPLLDKVIAFVVGLVFTEKQTMKIRKEHVQAEVDEGGDGFWLELAPGWRWDGDEETCHTVHAASKKLALQEEIVRCECAACQRSDVRIVGREIKITGQLARRLQLAAASAGKDPAAVIRSLIDSAASGDVKISRRV